LPRPSRAARAVRKFPSVSALVATDEKAFDDELKTAFASGDYRTQELLNSGRIFSAPIERTFSLVCHPEPSPPFLRNGGEACLPLARRGGQAGICCFLFSQCDRPSPTADLTLPLAFRQGTASAVPK
jgi:hypothetical protein